MNSCKHVLIAFFSLTDPNIRAVVLGTLLLTSSTAIVGTFALLKRKALTGDAIAHAALPGVCIAFMITEAKHPIYLTLGAFIAGWLALMLIDQITRRSKIKEDTATALVLSSTFGLGILLMTSIQHTGNAAQMGLRNFLFGKAATLMSDDLQTLCVLSAVLVLTVVLFFKEFALVAFDKAFAQASGLPVRRIERLFTTLTVLAIVIGIRAVGILLMAAMFITPAAAARFWTDRLLPMVMLAAVLGMLSGLVGSFVSYLAPAMPTGPWIVMTASVIAYGSFLLAPGRGLLARRIRRARHQKKTLTENILKLFYELGSAKGHYYRGNTVQVLYQHRPIPLGRLQRGLRYLQQQNMVRRRGKKWYLTAAGKDKGAAIDRLHRLWELYLTQYLRIKPDHVHDDAESIEHIITPELAEELSKLVKLNTKTP